MAKRGPKPKKLINTEWSPNLAYAVGLLATDGCLAKGQSLIDLTSKDKEQLVNFNKSLGVNIKIGRKNIRLKNEAWRVQIKNKLFYDFLVSVGLIPAKSLTIGKIDVPDEYFFDFLRGCFDGDGSFYSYWDPRWKSSFMFYLSFASASEKFILWLQSEIHRHLGIKGCITKSKKKNYWYQLKYAKSDSYKLISAIYADAKAIHLSRKKLKIDKALAIIRRSKVSV